MSYRTPRRRFLLQSSRAVLGASLLPIAGYLLSHGGDNPGFKAFILASAERQSGYVILTNGDNGREVIGKLASGDTPLNLFVTG